MILQSSFTSWVNHFLDYMCACFGCCSSTPFTAVDQPSKGIKIQGQTVKKSSLSDGFWSTSTCDIDFSVVQSQRSLSSNSVSNPSLSQSGLLLWNETRLKWVESTKPDKGKALEPVLSWNATYESLLGTNKRFPQPIPLSEMVEFLVERWELEGLYD